MFNQYLAASVLMGGMYALATSKRPRGSDNPFTDRVIGESDDPIDLGTISANGFWASKISSPFRPQPPIDPNASLDEQRRQFNAWVKADHVYDIGLQAQEWQHSGEPIILKNDLRRGVETNVDL